MTIRSSERWCAAGGAGAVRSRSALDGRCRWSWPAGGPRRIRAGCGWPMSLRHFQAWALVEVNGSVRA
jgi:hypothetical protein